MAPHMATPQAFDDIVIGSGLAALGIVLGLPAERRVLVIAGPTSGEFAYYDDRRNVPCAYIGEGGLGNEWHGVIPVGLNRYDQSERAAFEPLFRTFYPRTPTTGQSGQPLLFIPWKPIRPKPHLSSITARRGDRFVVLNILATRFNFNGAGVNVSAGAQEFRARRLWIACGALSTPALLEGSLGPGLARGLVSDHAFCYLGHVDGQPAPAISRSVDGMFMPVRYTSSMDALYTLRPARFAFRQLDFGIEQRAVFGLPTGKAVQKIARRLSPGLLVEAFFNRFGVLGGSPRHSVYAQVEVPDAYVQVSGKRSSLSAQVAVIRGRCDQARERQPYGAIHASQRPDLFIPGIHLHHSVDLAALSSAGLNLKDSPVQVVDASVMSGVGPDHHSFRMMVAAFRLAQASAGPP